MPAAKATSRSTACSTYAAAPFLKNCITRVLIGGRGQPEARPFVERLGHSAATAASAAIWNT